MAKRKPASNSDRAAPKRPEAFNDLPHPGILTWYEFFETADLDASLCLAFVSSIDSMPSQAEEDFVRLEHASRLSQYVQDIICSVPPIDRPLDIEQLGFDIGIALETTDLGLGTRADVVAQARERLGYLAELLRFRFAGRSDVVAQQNYVHKTTRDDSGGVSELRHPRKRGAQRDVAAANEVLREASGKVTVDTIRAKFLLAAEHSGLNNHQLGVKMGLKESSANQTVSRILNLSEPTNPTIDTLLKLANAIDVSFEDILRITS